jgi:hypothetical protein
MREHEVPTHLQAEDRVLLGLTFPQVVAGAAVLGLAYGTWQYAPLPSGARLVLGIVAAVAGLALTLLRPGGRALPAVALDLLRFFLLPKRYAGRMGDLAQGVAHPQPPPRRSGGGNKRRPRFPRFGPNGLLFRCLSVFLAAAILFTALAPHAALASGPVVPGQRLFIEALEVREGQATIAIRAATALKVRMATEAEDGRQIFQASDVLYQGERREYVLPLKGQRPAIAISWQDALGGAGVQVLQGKSLPYPLPRLQGKDCTLALTELRWEPGQLSGVLSSACNPEASEVVDLVLLQDPNDPSKVARQRVVVDAQVQDASGSVQMTATGPGGTESIWLPFTRDATTPFSLGLPSGGAIYTVSLEVDVSTTRVAQLPGKVELVTHEARIEKRTIPVVAWFEGFTTRVSATLRAVWDPFWETVSARLTAVWDPFVETVTAKLSAWFEPVTRVLTATLRATWSSFYETVGAWVSANVGTWVSKVVGTEVWAKVGTWVSTTVGKWVSATVGKWVSTTVGTWVSAWVGGFYKTVTTWVGKILSWLSISVWVPSKLASAYATGTASGYASGTAEGYASGTASGYAEGWASGYASGVASGYAEGVASGYASKQVLVPGKTEEKTVSEVVTAPGQLVEKTISKQVWVPGQRKEQTVSKQVLVPGRVSEKTVSKSVMVPGRYVQQDVTVEVTIPAYTSAEVVERQPLVRQHRERLSGTFGLYADAPYRPLELPPGNDGQGRDVPTQVEQYVRLLDEEVNQGGDEGGDSRRNPYRDALDRISRSPYFLDRPGEAARLRTLLFLRWLDSLSIPLDARALMEAQAGGVASGRNYRLEELPGQGVPARELFKALTGEELR